MHLWVSVFLVSLTPFQAHAIICEGGSYATDTGLTVCTGCRAGTYSTGTGITSAVNCAACLAGTYSTGEWMNSSATCTRCQAGTYGTGIGVISSSNCTSCQAGAYSSGSGMRTSATCVRCQAGTYSTATGATLASACTKCQEGSYSTGTGIGTNLTCTLCSAGAYYTGTGATVCTLCLAGKYSSGTGVNASNACTNCSYGTYANSGLSACMVCPDNTFSSEGKWQCTCNSGFYNLGASLLAYYPINPVYPLADIAGGVGDLTRSNSPTFNASGPFGPNPYSGLFTGSPNSFYFPPFTLPGNFTISVWYYINPTATPLTGRTIFNFPFNGASDHNFQAWIGAGVAGVEVLNTFNKINLGTMKINGVLRSTWYHLAVAVSGNSGFMWLNGVLSANTTFNGTRSAVYTSYNALGRHGVSAANSLFWIGGIDEFRLYNRLLTDSEVSALYQFRGDTYTAVSPIACAPGTYSTTIGSTSYTTCLPCAYATGYGTATCSMCAPGMYMTNNSICSLCMGGQYSTSSAATACSPCTAGKYSSGSGMNDTNTCTSCPAGTYSDSNGSTVCKSCTGCDPSQIDLSPCNMGQTSDTSNCTCSSGYYGTSACLQCPSHTTSLHGSKSALACTCLAGYSCTYTKILTLSLFLNLTEAYSPNSPSGLLNSPIMASVALAAGVPITNIKIGSISPIPANRRGLGKSTHQVTVFLTEGTSAHARALRLAGHELTWADTVEVTRNDI